VKGKERDEKEEKEGGQEGFKAVHVPMCPTSTKKVQ